ncbi:MAG: biotin--[acetyl-CoA-carboxylase] ligase [Thermaurantimonas sp.]
MFERHYISEVDSTNDWIKRRIESGGLSTNYLIYTLNQIKGRGQFSRIWDMQPGLDLAFSLYNKIDKELSYQFPTAYVMTVCLVLKDTFGSFGIKSMIKWPNDLLAETKKVAGILIESISQNQTIHTITGIGINLNSRRKHLSIPYTSISIRDVIGKALVVEDFLDEFEFQFEKWENLLNSNHNKLIYQLYNDCLFNKGLETDLIETKNQTKVRAKILCVDTWGRLVTEQNGNKKVYHNGEIKFAI